MSLILPICRVPVEVGRFLARHVFFSVILSMRGAKFQFLLTWSNFKCCRWLNKSCFWLAENGQKNCCWSFPSRMLPLRVFLAPLWCCCCFWSVTINQKPAGPPTLMGWKIWKKEFTVCWSEVAVTLNPVTKCPTMMHLKQKATPVRKKSERLLTRAWLDLTRVSHLQWDWKKVFHPSISAENDSRWCCAPHALLKNVFFSPSNTLFFFF